MEIIWTKFSHIKNSTLTQEYDEENTNKNQDKGSLKPVKIRLAMHVMMEVVKFESMMKTHHKS